MRKAVYPGTFDPITLGHLDVIAQVAPLFDELVVAVLHNPSKRPWFDLDERLDMIRDAVRAYSHVRADAFSGLLVDYCRSSGVQCVVRGVRNHVDLQNEMAMAQMNRALHDDLVTVFVPTSPEWSFVSSSLVKDVAMHGGDISRFVTPHVANALAARAGGLANRHV
ncbi:pantetheine-phosphate adenylyltransferase [Alicyclobacillus mali]|uniref:Phosphopantetheine adenylyltransferase n=1 Tax=Alicyclobacillus mali (ex Roth et al. 2021) TaxID=1123961 RepID=A0ABS0F4W0_9BACL|nr:pantetheine-phosphate adenylyltransferase [Alicyclobacillus mali (ex Roth et al. 2021)]MBF8378343.1 pantetheine-phosphate adenylyltransferase [Alicyclobacillus mali (ex Roth et al. 2021)]MCL6489378.1 pantetheine-phosphate adenylyltransferase [Alicyclobacillus mali (ex Roth et al. 2021)]